MPDILLPTESLLAALRALASAGFSGCGAKATADAYGWQLLDEGEEAGFLEYRAPVREGSDTGWTVKVLTGAGGRPGGAFVPLFFFEDYDQGREAFDRAFCQITGALTALLGGAQQSGAYRLPHRPAWPFSFAGWSLPEAMVILVQDEMDIQFGMDITLWVKPAGQSIRAPVTGA